MKQKKQMGEPLQAIVGRDRMELVGRPTIGPKEAMSQTLGAYLERIVFRIAAGDDGKEKDFRLNEVLTQWPSAGTKLQYPCGSIDEGAYDWMPHNFTPTMLEETAGCYGDGTVLWKTDEATIDFQVDFWTNTEAHREAIQAGLPRAFSPTEARSGILLQGHPDYFDRSVRVTYLGAEPVTTSEAVYEAERRLRATMRCDMDVVHLRRVNALQPVPTFDITDNT